MKTWLRLTLITMTVGGGFAGVILTIESLFNSKGHGAVYAILTLGFLALYTFVTASGLLFVHDQRNIRPLSVALAIQIPWISSPLIVYKFASGFHAVLSIGTPEDASNVGVHFGAAAWLGSTFSFFLFQEKPWSIGVNLFALSLGILLWKSAENNTPSPILHPTSSEIADTTDQSNSMVNS